MTAPYAVHAFWLSLELVAIAVPLNTVFGVGNPHADWLVIGEAPGVEEDRQGKPFVGPAGKLLDAMLQAIDLSRETNVFVANMLKCRPPGNRDPKPGEVAACMPYLMRQIAAIKPKLILAVGRIAAQNLLESDNRCSPLSSSTCSCCR